MVCRNVKFDKKEHWNWNKLEVEASKNTQIGRDISQEYGKAAIK